MTSITESLHVFSMHSPVWSRRPWASVVLATEQACLDESRGDAQPC